MIPKRFIRVWVGPKPIPELFEEWWQKFQDLHPDYEFKTIRGFDEVPVPDSFKKAIEGCTHYAGQSDIIRMLALYHIGGIYVDTDMLPLRSFESLRSQGQPFLGKRSGKAFEIAVMGSPKNHPAFGTLIQAFPAYHERNKHRATSVASGPAFYSSVLFGRPDVLHLPIRTFYPFDGWGGPKKSWRRKMFEDPANFPKKMLAAHLSNHGWNKIF